MMDVIHLIQMTSTSYLLTNSLLLPQTLTVDQFSCIIYAHNGVSATPIELDMRCVECLIEFDI